MSNLFRVSTRYRWRCRKAALILLALVLAALCALFTPADAQTPGVQSMVKNQPFPFGVGIAMDTAVYGLVKAKLKAADELRQTSKARILALQQEIAATRKALDDQARLGQYDAGKAMSLTVQMNVLQGKLATEQASLRTAQQAFDDILAKLPRKIRKSLSPADPDPIARATASYVVSLKNHRWYFAGGAGLVGMLLGLAIAF